MGEKILVAMSGGVDSAVAALVLKEEGYDKLIIASGASPIIPPIEGVDKKGVFAVRTPDDAIAIREYIEIRSQGFR